MAARLPASLAAGFFAFVAAADNIGLESKTWVYLPGCTVQAADAAGSAAHADRASNEGEGDVYMVDEEEGPGVWEVTVIHRRNVDIMFMHLPELPTHRNEHCICLRL